MFLSVEQLKKSLSHLEAIHPFYGITFLVCKSAELPIGDSIPFPISEKETVFLDKYYRPDESSEYYYQVFLPSKTKPRWIKRKKYASSTLQATRTQGKFAKAFIHELNSDQWGWAKNYVGALKAALSYNRNPSGRTIPAFDLAVWLYREREWPANITAAKVIETFCREFLLTKDETDKLFDLSIPDDLIVVPFFQDEAITKETLRRVIGDPPDAKPEEGGTLAFLECQGVGPAKQISFEPAERLSLITGDNGLGKTFLLESAWWALTGQWAGLPVYPRQDAKDAKITFQIAGEKSKSEKGSINYNWNTHSWPFPKKRPTIPGLIVYARVDGSFAVWDPVRNYSPTERGTVGARRLFVFTRRQVWDGLDGEIEGLIRDWGRWQSNPEKHPFETFKKVLHRLSPPDLGPLEPGELQRVPDDPRDIPTLKYPYGEVPIVCASAGVRRILTLAYLIVWAWNEHKIHSDLAHNPHQKRMVVLVDEMEAHLHPLWQRVVLPAFRVLRNRMHTRTFRK